MAIQTPRECRQLDADKANPKMTLHLRGATGNNLKDVDAGHPPPV